MEEARAAPLELSLRAAPLELSLRAADAPSLVGLELPFYATRVSRVLETVGGAASLQQAHESRAQFLPVKLRPSEPSCKPLFADLAKTQSVLLRVRRRRHAGGADAGSSSSSSSGGSAAVDAEVVGLVREKYVCEGMADFQYFTSRAFHGSVEDEARAPTSATSSDPQASETWQREPATGALCAAPPAQVALKASLRPYLRVRSERELEMIPEVFSKVDLPLKYEFRQRSGYQPTEKAKKTSSTMTYLNFYDDVAAPVEPKPENPALRRRPVGASDAVDDHVLRVLQAKLAAKPVWLRSMLFVGLDFLERRAARRLLRKLCYVFVDGPWRGSWIRMGYDPRKEPEAAKYQVIELRNNRELVHAKVTHPSRKRTKKASGANPKGPRIAKVTQTSENENAQASKRRRKERFLLSDTRRAYLADAQQQQFQQKQQQLLQEEEAAAAADGGDDGARGAESDADDDLSNEWDSDQDGEDGRDGVHAGNASGARGTSEEGAAGGGASGFSTSASGERTFTIFGVPLTSANVLFQLDDIEDDEVLAWTAQFAALDKPTLLGGWFSTHMFLPLREMIRLRIAALVGRSKADLDLRRKRIDALKKQALADYASGAKDAAKDGDEDGGGTDEGAADALDQAAFEETLVRERASSSEVADAQQQEAVASKVPTAAGEADENTAAGDAGGEVDDHSLDLNDEDEIREDEEEEAAVEALARQQERLERGRGAHSEEDDDDDEEDDEDEDDGDRRDDKRGVGVVVAAKTPEQLEPMEAMEYSF